MKMYSAKYFKLLIISLLSIILHQLSFSQTYQVNGAAVDKGNGLVRLTAQGLTNQTASAWSTSKIDLTQPYDQTFEMFFGCDSTINGGDGMTFTMHNDPRALNALGAGTGFLGIGGAPAIQPAVSIEFDTYDGALFGGGGSNEIVADHIAVDINGDVNQTISGPNTFIGTNGPTTVQAISGGRDLENCAENANNFYTVRIVWDPVAKTLQLYEEGTLTMTYNRDLITDIFGGNNMVYWGFTGATGSASNEQWIAPSGAIIPWECSATTSCCTGFTVTPNSPTTICNNPITLSVSGIYSSYYWSDGTTSSTLQVTAPGTYTLNVQQTQGGNLCPGSATFTITPTGPTAILSGGSTLCNASQTTPLSVALTGTPPWSLVYAIDGINQPAVTNITASPYVFQANGSHVYSLVSVSDNSGCNSNASGTATVGLYPGIPVGHDDFFTAPGTANLSVDNNGGTYVWYDDSTGSNVVSTGDTYTTPLLNRTTIYYVENTAATAYISKSVAMHDETSGDNPNRTDDAKGLPPAVCFLDFTANSSFLLDTITCAVNSTGAGNGQVTVYITSYTTPGPFAGAETLVKDSINIPITGSSLQKIKIPLNYSCTAGTNYHISYNATGVLQTEMYWQFMQATSFPITKDPELTIQQYGVPNTRYPGLFDWKIRIVSSTPSCGRTPVTAFVCPTAALSGNAVICNDGTSTTTLSVALTGDAPWTLTYAIDGVNQTAVSGIASSPYTFSSQTGAHTYTLVAVSNATSNGCANGTSGTATVTVNPDAPVGHDATFLPGNSATLSVNNTGGTYNWFTSATSNVIAHTGDTYTTSVLSSTTTYYVQQVIGTDTSCTRIPVTAYLCPTAALTGDAVICNDGTSTTTLSVALTGDAPWTLIYAIDGINQTAVNGIASSPYTFSSQTGAHTYTFVTVSNATSNGCANGTSGTATVTVKPDAPVGHDATFTSPGSALLMVDDAGGTYNWYDASTGGNLVHTGTTYSTPTLTATTTYYVEQVVGGQVSCSRTPVRAIVIVPAVGLFIPNLMTPNNDGKNDRFEVLGLTAGSDLVVYNRWGNVVYHSGDYDNNWGAENLSSGVYFYELKIKNSNSYKGWLEIIQ